MAKTPGPAAPAATAARADKPRRGIQSVEVGTKLLLELARHVSPMALRDLARGAGMSTGKAHPYLVSYVKVGFVLQDDAGRYELGPLALQLGLARLKRLDPVREAAPLIAELAEATGQSVGLAVWGNQGPTIVRLEEPVHPMHVNLRMGSVMALASTATGRLFAAYLPPKVVEQALADDAAHRGGADVATVRAQLEPLLAETRAHGLSRSIGQPIAGIDAFCAPVFDSSGNLVMGITAMGPSATFDTAWDGAVAGPLKRCADEVSARLGLMPRD